VNATITIARISVSVIGIVLQFRCVLRNGGLHRCDGASVGVGVHTQKLIQLIPPLWLQTRTRRQFIHSVSAAVAAAAAATAAAAAAAAAFGFIADDAVGTRPAVHQNGRVLHPAMPMPREQLQLHRNEQNLKQTHTTKRGWQWQARSKGGKSS
jgi:hypothetical protein